MLIPQSLSNILIHLVWSTKDRHPWLSPGIREQTHAFPAGAVRHMDCQAYRMGGVADHVHLAVRLSRTLSVADLVKDVKLASSKWLKERGPELNGFYWQQGYGAFSVGMSQKETLLHDIDTQGGTSPHADFSGDATSLPNTRSSMMNAMCEIEQTAAAVKSTKQANPEIGQSAAEAVCLAERGRAGP